VSEPVVFWDRGGSVGVCIVAAVIFLLLGFVGAIRPYLIQREAVRLYKPPFAEPDDSHLPFLESRAYILMLRAIGVACLAVGLGLTAILVGSALVPGFAKFQ
jgi:hypothetical protein